MVPTGETFKRQVAFIKGIGDESLKHNVNAIIDDDFWQMVKEEKLQERGFKLESSMSLAFHTGVDRRQEMNIDQWKQTNID